jgi:cation diffusion facilitator CzcD-associated flavoprotein CzcO
MRVAIVGAGFSGIGMGAALQRAGHRYTIFERSVDLGGVWQHNTYPGAACDVPSYVYSYSWAQRRDWSRPCSPQDEIQAYLRAVATDARVTDHLRFGAEVTEARWDATTLTWRLTIGGDRSDTHVADALVLGCGQLSRPARPEIPGADTFAGHAFHSAEWDHAHDLTGERVAVIGTGASAIQFVPEIAERVARLDLYQRSAPYLLPRRNAAYPEPVRTMLARVPGLQRLRRYGMCGVMEGITLGLTRSRAVNAGLRAWSTAFMRVQLRGDPSLRRQAWPSVPFGCKRILFSSTYLPALRRPGVELVTETIERITPDGIVTRDGVPRPVDTIIWATGFATGRFVTPMRVVGAGGVELQTAWRDGAQAHRGISVAGYPNLFVLYGPHTNLGAGSIIVMLEAQIRYVARALRLTGAGRAIDVRPEVQRDSAAEVARRLGDTVWTECHSWYRRDGDGAIVNNWPGFVAEYLRDTRHVRASDYRFVGPSAAG